jgi:membrane dipeptidase
MAYEMYPDEIDLAYSADDVERIHGEGKLVALIGVENAYGIGTDLSQWERYRELGARYVSLTHNGYSDFGDASVAGLPGRPGCRRPVGRPVAPGGGGRG